jgi:uncharacterized protein YdcH (DUF465 family)
MKKEKNIEVKKIESKEKISSNKKKHVVLLIIGVILLIFILTILGLTVFNNNWKEANNNYKIAYETVSKMNDELSMLINDSENLANSQQKALDETLKPTLETTISEAKAAKKELPSKPLLTKEINAKIEELNSIDYEEEYNNLKEKYDALDKSIKQYELVDNPTEEYVIDSLKKISSIVDISAVTEENDPNGKLNKQGGYTAQVYFTSKYVDQSDVLGSTVIEKGTDAGGSIEVYTTEEDAQNRESYLSAFDGGLLSSGSHKVIGTVLIRTSDKLTATKQKELETNIIETLTGEQIQEEVTVE